MAQSPARDDRALARRGRAQRAAGRRGEYRAWGHAWGAGARRPPASRMHAAGASYRQQAPGQYTPAVGGHSGAEPGRAVRGRLRLPYPLAWQPLAPLAAFELPADTRPARPTGSTIGRSHD